MKAAIQCKQVTSKWKQLRLNMRKLKEKQEILDFSRAKLANKYLLCRPKGGLNDCLFQVYKAITHSSRFKRRLIIDSTNWGLCDDFSNYFESIVPTENIQTVLTDQMRAEINTISCHPKSFQGKLDSYTLLLCEETGNFIDSLSKERPCIVTPDPPELLLLHDQCGGGPGYNALPYFKFTIKTADAIKEKLSPLPRLYKAVHLRASDVNLDYKYFLNLIKPKLKNSDVLICTDSLQAFKDSIQILDESIVHKVADIPDTNGERIHDNPRITTRATNIDSMADLMGLAGAAEIIYPIGSNIHRSGFTDLAINLSQRNDLLRQLLGSENWSMIYQN